VISIRVYPIDPKQPKQSARLWVFRWDERFDQPNQLRDAVLNSIPDLLKIDVDVVVDQAMTHADHPMPRDLGMALF